MRNEESRKVKTVDLLKKLESYPLFTENDVAKLVNKSQKYVRTLLYRLHKRRHIKRIEKGKYTVHDDPLIFASYIALPSYFSLWTALRYYNLTQQQPFDIFIMTPRAKRKIQFNTTHIRFLTTRHMFGYKKQRYNDFDIFIADREKTIIDSLLFKLPIADIREALEDTEINCQRLSDYAKRAGNKSIMKRLGYLLENIKGSSYGLKALDNNYARLDYLGKKRVKKEKKWKLLLNDT